MMWTFQFADGKKNAAKLDSSILRKLKNMESGRDRVFFLKSPLKFLILTMKEYGKIINNNLAENQTPLACIFER